MRQRLRAKMSNPHTSDVTIVEFELIFTVCFIQFDNVYNWGPHTVNCRMHNCYREHAREMPQVSRAIRPCPSIPSRNLPVRPTSVLSIVYWFFTCIFPGVLFLPVICSAMPDEDNKCNCFGKLVNSNRPSLLACTGNHTINLGNTVKLIWMHTFVQHAFKICDKIMWQSIITFSIIKPWQPGLSTNAFLSRNSIWYWEILVVTSVTISKLESPTHLPNWKK